jgi:hypothetical protein
MRKKVFVAALALALVLGAATVAFGTPPGNTITTLGSESFQPNTLIQATFRFNPGVVDVKSGGRLKLVYGNNGHDPHTISIVNQDQLPSTVGQVFNCQICNQILTSMDGHKRVLGADGGLNQPGDSLFLFAGQTTSVKVTAPPGTTLYYLCAIHPWMQGTIYVTK